MRAKAYLMAGAATLLLLGASDFVLAPRAANSSDKVQVDLKPSETSDKAADAKEVPKDEAAEAKAAHDKAHQAWIDRHEDAKKKTEAKHEKAKQAALDKHNKRQKLAVAKHNERKLAAEKDRKLAENGATPTHKLASLDAREERETARLNHRQYVAHRALRRKMMQTASRE